MQLTCPFCRRKPAVKTLARHNPRAATLGGLEPALADHGWFYAWCISCGFAKRAHERVCCEGDRVPPVHQFRCSDCTGVSAVDGIGRLTACPQCGVLVEKVRFLLIIFAYTAGLIGRAFSHTAVTTSNVTVDSTFATSVARGPRRVKYMTTWRVNTVGYLMRVRI